MQAAITQTHAWPKATDELRMSCGCSVELPARYQKALTYVRAFLLSAKLRDQLPCMLSGGRTSGCLYD